MASDWFARLVGFEEDDYEAVTHLVARCIDDERSTAGITWCGA
jgi:hypothetical protein